MTANNELHEACALVANLARVELKNAGERRFLESWRRYLKRAGDVARWSMAGAEAVLQLRTLRASGDFESYWKFHLTQEQKRQYAKLYADGQPPAIKYKLESQVKSPRLRVVK